MSMITGLALTVLLNGATPQIVWQAEPDPVLKDRAYGLSLCPDEEALVVVGELDRDIGVYKLSRGNGDSLWLVLCDNEGGVDIGYDVAVAPNGVVFVGATSTTETEPKLFMCGYSDSGELLWTKPYTMGGQNGHPALFCRHPDSCYVAGWYTNTISDRITPLVILFKEDGTSKILWSEIASSIFALTGIDINAEGHVYISASPSGCLLIKSDPAVADFYWNREYEDPDASLKGWQCHVAPSQEIYFCGQRQQQTWDFLLLKWEPTRGNLVWDQGKYYDLGAEEHCRDFALDSIADCYLAGWQERTDEDAALIKTDSAGNMLWSWVDSLEGDQRIEGIEVDSDGYIYLAGSHHNGENWDMLVMKVRQPLTISGRVTDSSGAPMASTPIKLTGDTLIEVVSDTDGFYEIEVYNGGSYTVEPDKPGWVFTPSSRTYDPLAHREMNQDFADGYWSGIGEKGSSTPIDLEVTLSAIHYTLPRDRHGTLNIFDPSGKLVDRMSVTGSGSLEFSKSLPSGVYLVQLKTEHNTVIRKALILR